jgi:hypothetical protein
MRWSAPASLVIVAALAFGACDSPTAQQVEKRKPTSEQTEKKAAPRPPKSKKVSDQERLDALSRASVWQPPRQPIAQAKFDSDPTQPQSIECTFAVTEVGGTAPKFDCTLENGERIRVKYGRSPEIPSEVAAARLLHALGFGADNVMLVEKLRCYGCPAEPFITMRTLGFAGAHELYGKVMNKDSYKDFQWVAVERKHYGRAIETEQLEGWAFFELDLIDPKKGGAPKTHVDALRLLAVLLAHWDNKSENQRLVCLSEQDWPDGGKCSRPLAMLQDVGSSFGPRKVDLEKWEQAPIWGDRATCTATMDGLPYNGATFKPVKITEAGRKHLASLLRQLTDEQLTALFRGARFDQSKGMIGFTASPIPEWVRVFKAKVREISDGPPCSQ